MSVEPRLGNSGGRLSHTHFMRPFSLEFDALGTTVDNKYQDTFTTPITGEIPRVLGALCWKWEPTCVFIINHNMTASRSRQLVNYY